MSTHTDSANIRFMFTIQSPVSIDPDILPTGHMVAPDETFVNETSWVKDWLNYFDFTLVTFLH